MPLPFVNRDYKANKLSKITWNSFRRGLNSFLRDVEIKENEVSKFENLMLVGSGIPTKRWGTANYYLSGSTGYVRGLQGYYKADGTNELLSFTDDGFLVKKSGASYAIITGASWASGYDKEMAQLEDVMYIVDGNNAFTNYDGSNINEYVALTTPSNLLATNLSGVSGVYTYSWRVSAESETGETLASTAVTLGNLPQSISDTTVKLTWTGSSPASSVQGYVVYGRDAGDETFLARVGSTETTYFDDGSDQPAILAATPTADTTGGPIAKYMVAHNNRIVLAGISSQPSRIMVSGRENFSDVFHWSKGGAYLDIDKDSGDDIVGLGTFGDKIIVFKERSVWAVKIGTVSYGAYDLTELTATAITKSHGGVSNKSISFVENDVMYLSRNGVYVVGYEPNILNVIRANEVSFKIRDFFEDLTYSDLQVANAEYFDNKYVISFPTKSLCYVYDRERLAWMGPWRIAPYDIHRMHRYYDAGNDEKWLAGTRDSWVTEFSSDYSGDRSTGFSTTLKTRREDWKDWSAFKNVWDLLTEFREVQGQIDVEIIIEAMDGGSSVASNFSVTTTSTNAGWGSSQWGDNQWGDSEEAGSASDLAEIVRRLKLEETLRTVQVQISTSGINDNYELLGIRINAKPVGRGTIPYDWNV